MRKKKLSSQPEINAFTRGMQDRETPMRTKSATLWILLLFFCTGCRCLSWRGHRPVLAELTVFYIVRDRMRSIRITRLVRARTGTVPAARLPSRRFDKSESPSDRSVHSVVAMAMPPADSSHCDHLFFFSFLPTFIFRLWNYHPNEFFFVIIFAWE